MERYKNYLGNFKEKYEGVVEEVKNKELEHQKEISEIDERIEYLKNIIRVKRNKTLWLKISGLTFLLCCFIMVCSMNITNPLDTNIIIKQAIVLFGGDAIVLILASREAIMDCKEAYRSYEESVSNPELICDDPKKAKKEIELQKEKRNELVQLIDEEQNSIEDIESVLKIINECKHQLEIMENAQNRAQELEDIISENEVFIKYQEENKRLIESEFEKYLYETKYNTHLGKAINLKLIK